MRSDLELLAEYAESRSEPAFDLLVEKYLRLVYSTALRRVQDSHLAEDVSQAVFIVLARKAHTLRKGTLLGGWLYRTTCFAAADAMKKQRRRAFYEQQLTTLAMTPDETSETEPAAFFLDEAIAALREKDRAAIILRFFENRTLAEVGNALGLSEDAARMRVSRALEHLRKFLRVRKVALPAGAMLTLMAAQTTQAAPAGLAASVKAMAALHAGAAAAPAVGIANATLKTIGWLKVKSAAYVCGGVLLAAAIADIIVSGSISQPWPFGGGLRYEVSGTLRLLPATGTAASAPIPGNEFLMQMKRGIWSLKLDFSLDTNRHPVVYEYDGSRLTYSFQRPGGSGLNTRPGTQTVIEGSPVVSNLFSPFLRDADWLLLASCLHLYFFDLTNNWGWSPTLLSKPNSRVTHPFAITWGMRPSGKFPGDVWFHEAGFPSLAQDGSVRTEPLPPPFSGGELLGGHLSIGPLTNADSPSMPMSFRYDRFLLPPGATTTNDLYRAFSVEGVVSKLHTNHKATP
jgi:RNA polymerase sigma factor (sigma-70 family)